MTGAAEQSFFSRDKSGFVREFSLFDVFVFNVVGYSLGVALTTNPVFIGGFAPHSSIYAVLILGALVAVFNGLTYGLFAAAMPRNGGDYVFVGRTLSPGLGFVANWGFTFTQIYGLGLIAGWTVSQALSPALTTVGYTAGYRSLVDVGARLSQPGFAWLGGTALLVLVFAILSFGQRGLKLFLNVLFFAAIAGTLVMGYAFISTDHQTFVLRLNEFMAQNGGGPAAYERIVGLGAQHGLALNQPLSWPDSMRAMPLGFLIFLGFTYSVYVGSEVKEPQKAQSRGILLALAFGFAIFMVVMGRYYSVVGQDFNSAIGMEGVADAAKLPAGTSMAFFAGLVLENKALNVIMNVGTFLWFFLLPFVMVQVCVRNVHAWALDNLIPDRFVDLTSRGFPWLATLAVLFGAELFLAASYYWGIALIAAPALCSVCFFIAGCAGALFPYRRGDLYRRSPPLVQKQFLGLPVIAICGAISAGFFLWIFYASIRYPQVSGTPSDSRALVIVASVYGFGVAYYLLRRNWLTQLWQKRGINPMQFLAELPPE